MPTIPQLQEVPGGAIGSNPSFTVPKISDQTGQVIQQAANVLGGLFQSVATAQAKKRQFELYSVLEEELLQTTIEMSKVQQIPVDQRQDAILQTINDSRKRLQNAARNAEERGFLAQQSDVFFRTQVASALEQLQKDILVESKAKLDRTVASTVERMAALPNPNEVDTPHPRMGIDADGKVFERVEVDPIINPDTIAADLSSTLGSLFSAFKNSNLFAGPEEAMREFEQAATKIALASTFAFIDRNPTEAIDRLTKRTFLAPRVEIDREGKAQVRIVQVTDPEQVKVFLERASVAATLQAQQESRELERNTRLKKAISNEIKQQLVREVLQPDFDPSRIFDRIKPFSDQLEDEDANFVLSLNDKVREAMERTAPSDQFLYNKLVEELIQLPAQASPEQLDALLLKAMELRPSQNLYKDFLTVYNRERDQRNTARSEAFTAQRKAFADLIQVAISSTNLFADPQQVQQAEFAKNLFLSEAITIDPKSPTAMEDLQKTFDRHFTSVVMREAQNPRNLTTSLGGVSLSERVGDFLSVTLRIPSLKGKSVEEIQRIIEHDPTLDDRTRIIAKTLFVLSQAQQPPRQIIQRKEKDTLKSLKDFFRSLSPIGGAQDLPPREATP